MLGDVSTYTENHVKAGIKLVIFYLDLYLKRILCKQFIIYTHRSRRFVKFYCIWFIIFQSYFRKGLQLVVSFLSGIPLTYKLNNPEN